MEAQEIKTRQIKPTDKPRILVVLDESIRIGKEKDFNYDSMIPEHTHLKRIASLSNMIRNKKKIFDNLDQNSFMFQRILDTAILALRKLQADGKFNFYSAELIMKFLKLEEVFLEKNLKTKEVRFAIEEKSILPKQEVYKIKEEKRASEIKGDEIFVREGITGANLIRQKEKKEEEEQLSKALEDFDFDEKVSESDIMNELSELEEDDSEIEEDEEQQNDALNEL